MLKDWTLPFGLELGGLRWFRDVILLTLGSGDDTALVGRL